MQILVFLKLKFPARFDPLQLEPRAADAAKQVRLNYAVSFDKYHRVGGALRAK